MGAIGMAEDPSEDSTALEPALPSKGTRSASAAIPKGLRFPRVLGLAALLAVVAYLLGLATLPADWPIHLFPGTTRMSSLPKSGNRSTELHYEIIMDAGSSGTRIHVYRYTLPKGEVFPIIHHPEATLKQEPGLSSQDPAQVEEHLRPLLEFAVGHVPEWAQAETPVVLLATAGLRLLPTEQAEALLSAVRETLKRSPFESRPGWTGMLSGQDEGLFSWLAASYGSGMLQRRMQERERAMSLVSRVPEEPSIASGSPNQQPRQSSEAGIEDGSGLGKLNSEPVALVELGGASAQVTFEHHAVGGCVVHVDGELLGSLDLPGIDNSFVTNSFLGFGLDVAQQQVAQMLRHESKLSAGRRKRNMAVVDPAQNQALPVVEGRQNTLDPCMPSGWNDPEDHVVGTGNFSACLELAQKVMRGACEDHTCTISGVMDPAHSASGALVDEGVTLPRFRGKILAVENFFYTSSILGLKDEPTLAEVEEAGQRYCSTPWEELIEIYITTGRVRHEKDLLKYCFSAAYIVVFLHNGLGVGREERRVHFTNSVTDLQGQEVPVRWALGALVMRAAERTRREDITLIEYIQREIRGILSTAAEGWGFQEQVDGAASQQGGPFIDGEVEGQTTDQAAVVFSCGPDFCCAVASVPGNEG